MRNRHGNTLSSSQQANFIAAVVKALPRDMSPETAKDWEDAGGDLTDILRKVLLNTENLPVFNRNYLHSGTLACKGVFQAKETFCASINGPKLGTLKVIIGERFKRVFSTAIERDVETTNYNVSRLARNNTARSVLSKLTEGRTGNVSLGLAHVWTFLNLYAQEYERMPDGFDEWSPHGFFVWYRNQLNFVVFERVEGQKLWTLDVVEDLNDVVPKDMLFVTNV